MKEFEISCSVQGMAFKIMERVFILTEALH